MVPAFISICLTSRQKIPTRDNHSHTQNVHNEPLAWVTILSAVIRAHILICWFHDINEIIMKTALLGHRESKNRKPKLLFVALVARKYFYCGILFMFCYFLCVWEYISVLCHWGMRTKKRGFLLGDEKRSRKNNNEILSIPSAHDGNLTKI